MLVESQQVREKDEMQLVFLTQAEVLGKGFQKVKHAKFFTRPFFSLTVTQNGLLFGSRLWAQGGKVERICIDFRAGDVDFAGGDGSAPGFNLNLKQKKEPSTLLHSICKKQV